MSRAAAIEKPALRIDRHYDATPAEVWRAWTDPQALSAWFGPGEANSVTLAETDVRVGGRFHIVFGMPDGQVHDVSGTYLVVEPGRRLSFTWAWKSTPERESRVTIGFEAAGAGTRMNFVHEQFFDEEARAGHQRGWTASFDKLARHLGRS